MNSITCILGVSALLLASAFNTTHAQTYYSTTDLNFSGYFGSPPQLGSDGSWYSIGSTVPASGVNVVRLARAWKAGVLPEADTLPSNEFYVNGFYIDDKIGWLGQEQNLLYTTDLKVWNAIDMAMPDRELKFWKFTPLGDTSVVASIGSWVRVLDTVTGAPTNRVKDLRNRVEIITPHTRKLLYQDSGTNRNHLTQSVPFGTDRFIVGLSILRSDGACMAILNINGDIQYISAPANVPENAFTTYMHATVNGDYYCFYYSAGEGSNPPFAVVYHSQTGLTEYFETNMTVDHATSEGDLLVCSGRGEGLMIIKGTTPYYLKIEENVVLPSGTTWKAPFESIGAAFVNADTLIATSRNGMFVFATSMLAATSVDEPTEGRVIAGASNFFPRIVDGTQPVSWTVFDNAGRAVRSGALAVGERDLTLPLAGVSSGVYHLQLIAGGVLVRNQSLLLTE